MEEQKRAFGEPLGLTLHSTLTVKTLLLLHSLPVVTQGLVENGSVWCNGHNTGEDSTGVYMRSALHGRTVDQEVKGARQKDPVKLGKTVVKVCTHTHTPHQSHSMIMPFQLIQKPGKKIPYKLLYYLC